jgi:hypothetical protein
MAHVRKDTLARTVEWWKHLRWRKRDQSKRERAASKKEIRKELE